MIPRQRVLLWFLLALVIGGAAGWLLQDYLAAYLQRIDQIARERPQEALERLLDVLEPIFGTMALLLLGFATYLGRYGSVAIRTSRFPPPGAWVVEGRRTLKGSRARWAGWSNIAAAILLTLCALATVYYTWIVLPRLFAAALGAAP